MPGSTSSTGGTPWSRTAGARTAVSRSRSQPITPRTTSSTPEVMKGPPEPPAATSGRPSRTTMVGDMLDAGRLPGATALAAVPTSPYVFGTPGATEKSSISLFRMMPVPGTMMPAPNDGLIVVVRTTASPAVATTDTLPVPASRTGSSSACGQVPARTSAPSLARRAGVRSASSGTSVKAGSPYQRARSKNAYAMAAASVLNQVTSAAGLARSSIPSASSTIPPDPGGGKVTIVRPREDETSGRRHSG